MHAVVVTLGALGCFAEWPYEPRAEGFLGNTTWSPRERFGRGKFGRLAGFLCFVYRFTKLGCFSRCFDSIMFSRRRIPIALYPEQQRVRRSSPLTFAAIFVGYLHWDLAWVLWHQATTPDPATIAHHVRRPAAAVVWKIMKISGFP